jgi:hypothetical protein
VEAEPNPLCNEGYRAGTTTLFVGCEKSNGNAVEPEGKRRDQKELYQRRSGGGSDVSYRAFFLKAG